MEGFEGQSSKSNNAVWKDEGLIDKVFSWSLEDILNEDLYKSQVQKIPESFESVRQYFRSYIFPLVEETRSELCAGLEVLSRAPFAEVTSIEAVKPYGRFLYNVQVDYWRNRSTKLGQEPYRTLPGDIFVIADAKPETVADLQCPGRTWSLAWVSKVTYNGCHSSVGDSSICIKLQAAKDIGIGDSIPKSLFVVFLVNITPNNRIWRSLHLSGNVNIIKEVLCTNSEVEEVCSQCSLDINAIYAERLGSRLPSTLNGSQRMAILSSLCSGSLKNCEQVICKMESESKCNQPKSKEKCEEKKQPLLVWEPKGTKK